MDRAEIGFRVTPQYKSLLSYVAELVFRPTYLSKGRLIYLSKGRFTDLKVDERVESRNMNVSTPQTSFSNSSSVVTKTPILNEGTVESKREEILAYFHQTFSLYESLFECLVDDDAYYARANMLRPVSYTHLTLPTTPYV